mmetsp:Transcript_50009/g.160070  ORF Transcript_50009/g.160070 Transcript_50009/m.160070 type:complete len:209 (-) Transcript_50009:329-955(-)
MGVAHVVERILGDIEACCPSLIGLPSWPLCHSCLLRRYWKMYGSEALIVNLALSFTSTCLGPETIVTSGGVVSTVHSYSAGVGSSAPNTLVARTAIECVPSVIPSIVKVSSFEIRRWPRGRITRPPSSRYAYVNCMSEVVTVKVALLLAAERGGPFMMVVSGAPMLIVHSYLEGVGSMFPARSMVRTSTHRGPAFRFFRINSKPVPTT